MERKRNIKCFNNVSLSDPSPFLLYLLVEFAADEGQKKRKKKQTVR